MAMPAGWRREGNLPPEPGGFVGRARTIAGIQQRMRENRLVTITGVAGVGKTRTALQVVRRVRNQYPDGVWLVDLYQVRDPALLVSAIGSALGLADQSARPEIDALVEWISERRLLLFLDTCEHLVEPLRDLVTELLGRADQLRVIATSRQSLGVPDEQTTHLFPLTVPGEVEGEDPFSNEAVRLFAERAVASVPEFALDDDNIDEVAELCRKLDGIPLAIELAAGRLRTHSVPRMLGLLADRFTLLAGASRTALSRHQTIGTAVGWSHELCEPAERLLWVRLSVFAGDFSLEAVRRVCASDDLPDDRIAGLVDGLVDKSVLMRQYDGPAGTRYRLIDTLREYAQKWLAELGDAQRIQRRHRDYYLWLARRGETAWAAGLQPQWFAQMRQEHGNIRAAVEFCLADPAESRAGLELLSALWFMWVGCGFAREGRLYLERALAVAPQPSKERCKALWVLSYIRSQQGDTTGALEAAERCSQEAVQVGDPDAIILATKMQGTAAALSGDLQKAVALLGVAIKFHQNDQVLSPGLLPAIVELAFVLIASNDAQQAEELIRQCLGLCERSGEQWLRSHALWALSLAQHASGRPDEGLRSARAGLRLKLEFHDVIGALMCLETLGGILVTTGAPETGARVLGAAEANWRLFGKPLFGSPFFQSEHENAVKECRRLIGDEAYEEAFARGGGLALDEAIMLALTHGETVEPYHG